MLAPWRRIALPALLTFVAGFLVGQALPQAGTRAGLEELPQDLQAYAEAMVQSLHLQPEQAKDLRVLLFHYQRQRRQLWQRQLANADQEWVDLDQQFESLLAYRVLTPEQRLAAKTLRQAKTVVPTAAPR